MCRGISFGGRRCPYCGSYKARARNNTIRRHGRKVRRTIAEHLKSAGHPETAAMVMATPPSGMAAIIDKLDIPETVVDGLNIPGTHSSSPDVTAVIAAYEQELKGSDEPDIVAAAEARRDAALEEFKDIKRRRTNLVRRISKLSKEVDAGGGDSEKLGKLMKQKWQLIIEQEEAKKKLDEAEAEVLEAGKLRESEHLYQAYLDSTSMSEEERDAYLAGLSATDIENLCRYREMQSHDSIEQAIAAGGIPKLADRDRDTDVYVVEQIPYLDGTQIKETEGRRLDANTAIVRHGTGDFVVLYKNGDAYEPVAVAGSKVQALSKANNIPVMTELEPLPEDASELEKQVWAAKKASIVEAARKSADAGHLDPKAAATTELESATTNARTQTMDLMVTGPIEADVSSAKRRHTKREREKKAEAAGELARKLALENGKSKKAAAEAYEKARRNALGTPTLGGGVIPHFDHKIPPESLGEAKYASLTRSGLRPFGKETANDYSIVHSRLGNTAAWGFGSNPDVVATSSITDLNKRSSSYLQSLDKKERDALVRYTTNDFRQINGAITGRNKNPDSSITTTVERIHSSFEKLKEANKDPKPMNLVRGASVPSGWKGTAEEFLEATYTPGAKMAIGKVTSCSTSQSFAANWGSGYSMVVRSRSGVAVQSISTHPSEDEVILPMGAEYRCVEVRKNGFEGRPTVYLVEEDLVAEAQDSA